MIIFCKTSEGTFMVDRIASLFYQQMMTDDIQRELMRKLSKFIEKKSNDFKKLKDDEGAFKVELKAIVSEVLEEYRKGLEEETMDLEDVWDIVEEELKEQIGKVPDEIHYFWDELPPGEAFVIEVEYRRSDDSLGKVVTTYDVFICNDEGKTIHHLSPWKES